MSTPNDPDALAKAAAGKTPGNRYSSLAKAAAGSDEARDPLWDVRQRALEYLDKVWPRTNQACPICKNDNWFINNIAVLPVRDSEPLSGMSNRVYPLVPICCAVCGYTFFINERWVRGDQDEDAQ